MTYKLPLLFVLALFSASAMGATANEAVTKATGEHYTATKAAAKDRDVALAKCKKESTPDKRKVCRAETASDYKKAIAKADAAKEKAVANADVKAVKEEVKAAPEPAKDASKAAPATTTTTTTTVEPAKKP